MINRCAAAVFCVALFACSDGGTGPKPEPQPAFVDVTTSALTLARRDTARVEAVVLDAQRRQLAGRTVRWSSDEPGIAEVSIDGLVRGVAPGTATLTAAAGQITATADVTVTSGLAITIDAATDIPDGARARLARMYTLTDSASLGELLRTRGTGPELVLGVDADGAPILLALVEDSIATIGAHSTAFALVRVLFLAPGLTPYDGAALDAAIRAHPALPALATAIADRTVAGLSLIDWAEAATLIRPIADDVAAAVLVPPALGNGSSGTLPLAGLGNALTLEDDGAGGADFIARNHSRIAFVAHITAVRTAQPIGSVMIPPVAEPTALPGAAGMVRIDVGQSDSTLARNGGALAERVGEAMMAVTTGNAQIAEGSDWPLLVEHGAGDATVLDAVQSGDVAGAVHRLLEHMNGDEGATRVGDALQAQGAGVAAAARFAQLADLAARTIGGVSFLRDYVDTFHDTGRFAALSDSVVACQPEGTVQECTALVELAPAALILAPGGTGRITAIITGAAGSDLSEQRSLVWASSDAAVATVDQTGLVTVTGGNGATTTITVTEAVTGIVATATIDVGGGLERITVAPASADLLLSDSQTLTATLYDENDVVLSGRTVAWASADVGVATVDDAGTVTAVGAGRTTITATAEDVAATVPVSVVDPDDPPSAAGTYALESFRGVPLGGVCGVGCGWSVECETCSMIIEDGVAVLTDSTWDFVIRVRRANVGGGYDPPSHLYDSSGPLQFHALTQDSINVPAEAWCQEPGLVAGSGYCSELPPGWVFSFRFLESYEPYLRLADDRSEFVSGIGGQTIWTRTAP